MSKRIISPVIYYGGKSTLAPWIVRHFPSHRIYVELFGGGASVLLAKPRVHTDIYNDLEGDVVNFFRVARDSGQELKRLLWLTPYAREEFADVVNGEKSDDPVERARRFLVTCRQGYGGSGTSKRYFSAGNWKTASIHPSVSPKHTWLNAIDGRMDQLIERFQGVAIENRDFEWCIKQFDTSETLFYADPPYLREGRNFKHQYRHDFDDDDHTRLARALASIKGKVVVSYHQSAQLDELYPKWRRAERASQNRAVLVKGGTRRRTTEALLMNFPQETAEGA